MKTSEVVNGLLDMGFKVHSRDSKHIVYKHQTAGEMFTVSQGSKMAWFYHNKLRVLRRRLQKGGHCR